MRVWGWRGEWVRGRRLWLFARVRAPAAAGPGVLCVRAGTARGPRACGAVCVRARPCGGPVCICVCAGPLSCSPPARRSPFGVGMFSKQAACGRPALLQPEPEGERRPPQASGDLGSPGTADRHL